MSFEKLFKFVLLFSGIFFGKILCPAHAELIEMREESYGVPQVFEMGEGSYGTPQVFWGGVAQLKIGKYCSIAGDVIIFLGGEHRTDWVTTYPFSCLWPEIACDLQGHPKTKGDVIIGNDVWIGTHAFILSGVKVGDGAVVGARAVVAKDVPPYAIVAGNPARVIRYRFDETTIQTLLKIEWWNWSQERIAYALPYMLSDNIDAFIRYCEKSSPQYK